MIGGQLQWIHCDPQLALLPSEQCSFGYIGYLLDALLHFRRNSPQRRRIVVSSPESHRQHGYIVNRAGLDQWLAGARGDPVKVCVQFVIGSNDGIFFFHAHIKPNDHQRATRLAGGVEILDTRHFVQQMLHGNGDALFDLLCRCARHAHKHIEHGDDDLRLFFARGLPDAEQPKQERGDNHERGQRRIDECVRDPSCQSEAVTNVSPRPPALLQFSFHPTPAGRGSKPPCHPPLVRKVLPSDLPGGFPG